MDKSASLDLSSFCHLKSLSFSFLKRLLFSPSSLVRRALSVMCLSMLFIKWISSWAEALIDALVASSRFKASYSLTSSSVIYREAKGPKLFRADVEGASSFLCFLFAASVRSTTSFLFGMGMAGEITFLGSFFFGGPASFFSESFDYTEPNPLGIFGSISANDYTIKMLDSNETKYR